MASRYDSQELSIRQRKALADAIRASGNEAIDPARSAGRFIIPTSPWEHADRAVKQVLGGYLSGKASRDEAKLAKRKSEDERRFIEDLAAAEAPVPSSPLIPDQSMQIEARNPATGANESFDVLPSTPADRKRRMLALAAIGVDLDGFSGMLARETMARELAPKQEKVERVDVGDKIAVFTNGKLTGYLPKGSTPDAAENRRAAEAARLSGQEFTRGENEATRALTRSGQDITKRGQDTSAANAAAARDAAGKKLTGEQADARTKLGQVNATRDSLTKLRESSGTLSDWQTGPLAGRRPGVTDAEQTFEADVALVTGQLLAATKVPGTGAQSDRDAARLDALTPRLSDDKKARNRKIEGLARWLDEIEATNTGLAGGSASAAPRSNLPATNAKGWALHTDANGNRAYVSPDGSQFEEAQ